MVTESFIPTVAPTLFGTMYFGPIIVGFIIGLIVGSFMYKSSIDNIKLRISSWIAIIIGGMLVAFWLGNFPYYGNFPYGTGFVMAIIGAIIGRKLFGTKVEA